MKNRFLLYIIFIAIVLTTFFAACSDKDDDTSGGKGKEEQTDNEYVNNWIMDSMSVFYLWNNHLPEKTKLDFNANPYNFFGDLIKYEAQLYNGYAFSRMEGTHINIPKSATAETNTTSSDIGFEFIGAWYNNPRVAITITYVKKGTNAEKMGLKRGQAIIKVDGQYLYDQNSASSGLYWIEALYRGKSSYTVDVYDPITKQETHDLTLNVTPNYQENPIFLDSIYTINGRNIGYVMYNSYEAGGETTLPYDVELSKVFTRFKDNGVKDLIFDLRYNGGGLVRSAKFIASALVPNRTTDKIFEVKTYNTDIQSNLDKMPDNNKTKISWMYEYFTNNIQTTSGQNLAPIPELGDQLDNICFIGTEYTASASEMTINTLKPYYAEAGKNIYLVGGTTVGKNVGSWAIYEENNSKNTYVLWPITFQSHNKLYFTNKEESSNYANGFKPDLEAEDFEMLATGVKAIGDNEETLLKAAISMLTGSKIKSYTKRGSENAILKGKSSLNRKKERNIMYTDKKDIKDINKSK